MANDKPNKSNTATPLPQLSPEMLTVIQSMTREQAQEGVRQLEHTIRELQERSDTAELDIEGIEQVADGASKLANALGLAGKDGADELMGGLEKMLQARLQRAEYEQQAVEEQSRQFQAQLAAMRPVASGIVSRPGIVVPHLVQHKPKKAN